MSKKTIFFCLLIFAISSTLSFSIFNFYTNNFPLISQLLNYSITLNSPSPTSLAEPDPALQDNFQLPTLALDSIFNSDHSWIDRLPKDQVITIITTGDVIPARTVNFKMTQYNDFTHPFLKTSQFLKSADITLINLESPLTKSCPVTTQGMVFCGNQRFIDGLKFAGIDVANLANNHSLNWGPEGIQQTIDLLTNNNILAFGFPINNLTIQQFNNLTFGFLGWNFLDPFIEEEILSTIKLAKEKVDFLIISPHWGAEYQPYPSLETINLAHKMIDNGADLITGNHPHWTQPVEIYQDKLIIYAHGNFIFDQEWSQETKIGYVAKIIILKNKVIDAQLFPVYISDYNQPEFLKDEAENKVLTDLKNRSQNLASENKTSSP